MKRASYWTCRRQRNGTKCLTRNPSSKRKCAVCLKPRPPRRKPAHLAALNTTYEDYVILNGGEFCAICKRLPSVSRRLDRDHSHDGTGRPRGLLCTVCNLRLTARVSPEWLRAAADYLERTA